MGVAVAARRMLACGLVPCAPAVDVGFDLVSAGRSGSFRLQVKTVRKGNTWKVCRRPTGMVRGGKYFSTPGKSYERGDFEAFVFVRLEDDVCHVVPAAVALKNRHKISLRDDSEWRDAWHLAGAAR
jgi:hypothetical protein